MGSGVGKVFSRKPAKIEFMESTKMPNAKEVDTRRRNSLMFFMRDWQELTTFEQQEASMVQVCGMKEESGNIRLLIVASLSCRSEWWIYRETERGWIGVYTRTGMASTQFSGFLYCELLRSYACTYRQSTPSSH